MSRFRRFPTMGDGLDIGVGQYGNPQVEAEMLELYPQLQQAVAAAAQAAAQAAAYAQAAQTSTTIAAISAAELGASNASEEAANANEGAQALVQKAQNLYLSDTSTIATWKTFQPLSTQAQASADAAVASESNANVAGNKQAAAQLLGALSPAVTNQLQTKNPSIPIMELNGFYVPQTVAGAVAGAKAAANQLTLELQAGNITQAQWNQAIATLTPSGQN